jgi:polyribonucleotide nucleotidyltransferase
LTDSSHDKTSRDEAILSLRKQTVAALSETYETKHLEYCFNVLLKHSMRQMAEHSWLRVDGRGLDEIRPIFIETDVYPKLHGSAIFQRGQSQVMGTITFDSLESSFRPDAIAQLLGAQQRKSFMVHYEFPAFAVNQLSESSARFNRRSLGHGNLAEKALKRMIPNSFPYCIRLDCQVLESNGSTSMASACVGSLALFDAGVPLKLPVAGIAIGLFDERGDLYKPDGAEKPKTLIMTDLMGMEDFAGDMDFKITGTSKGFTAMQLDVSVPGISTSLVKKCLGKARLGLDHILKLMNQAMPKPRSSFKSSVPVMESILLPSSHRAILFRANAYNAKLIGAETGAQFFVEDDERITIMAPSLTDLETAKRMMKEYDFTYIN